MSYLPQIFDRAVADNSSRLAVIEDSNRWTFAELSDEVNRIAALLKETVPGDAVGGAAALRAVAAGVPGAIVEWIETAVGHRSNGNPSPACSPVSRLLPYWAFAAAAVAALAAVAIQVPAAAAGSVAVDRRQVVGEELALAAVYYPGRIASRSRVVDLTVVVEVLVVLRFPLSVSTRQ